MRVNHRVVLIWLISILCITLFYLPLEVNNAALVVLIAYCSFLVTVAQIKADLVKNRLIQLLIALFIAQLIGLVYTANLKAGFFMLEKKFCFLVLPTVLVPAIRATEIKTNYIFRKVGEIAFYGSWILIVIAFFRQFILGYSKAFYFESFRSFEGFTSIHYVYFSMFFGTGSLFFINSKFDSLTKRKIGYLLLIIIFLYCTFVMVLVSSKTGIGAFVGGAFILLYHKLKSKRIFALASSSVIITAFAFLYFNQTTRERFSTGLSHDLAIITSNDLPADLEFTDLNMRLVFWKISLTHLFKDGLAVTGVGTGDAQDYIDSLYRLPQYQITGYIGWNSHNQWVSLLVQLGVLGIVGLFLVFFYAVRKSQKENNLYSLISILIIFVFSITESILEVNKGIVFFALFFAVLAASERESNSKY